MTGARKRWGIDETMDLDEMGREGEDCDGKRRRMKHWIACALRHSPPLPRGHFRAHFRDNRWREGKQRRRRRMRRKSRIKTWLAQQQILYVIKLLAGWPIGGENSRAVGSMKQKID